MHGLILHEDEHLLVVNKPPGWNTHSPSPYAGEGVYDWLRHREPHWASLAIIHRLDKETSGVLVFSKTPLANRVLTGQFARREVRKEYRLITGRPVRFSRLNVKTGLARAGARYVVRPVSSESDFAETRFETLEVEARGTQIRAIPITGRTHQIRVHAAARGFPVLGDILYGGEPATRLHLHAERVVLHHPASNEPVEFQAPADFSIEPWRLLRDAIVEPSATEAWRMVHGASDPVLELTASAD